MDKQRPTRDEVTEFIRSRRNWGRWGQDDQKGTLNLVGPENRLAATRLVRSGRVISLSRPLAPEPAPGNPYPATVYMKTIDRGNGAGLAEDYVGVYFHGTFTTHIDALCHAWDADGMWNGRSPTEEIGFDGSSWASIDHWKEGIITRGVLLDIPRLRGEPYVRSEQPVTWSDLEAACASQEVEVGPGDALVVYSGREAWDRENERWASLAVRPGLDASCMGFLREHDCAALIWDMTDRMPNGYELPFGVHAAIASLGIALVDAALLEPLAQACREDGRWEFMVVVSPLVVPGGTGSPVNPLAIL